MFKRLRVLGFIGILSFISSWSLFSQDPVPVEISSNKVSIEGKQYYIHIVQDGQTLHSISRTYKVKTKEIIKLNPGAEFGLKINQALKIPVSSNDYKPEEEIVNQDHKEKDTMFIAHITNPGETVYGISKEFNVSEDTLFTLNPGLHHGLKSGMVLKIPRQNVTSTSTVKVREKNISHNVQKKETLYSISKQYNVSISSIINSNKELLWGGLKEGQVIFIPVLDTVDVMEEMIVLDSSETKIISNPYFRLLTNQEKYDLNHISIPKSNAFSNEFNVALLLPFNYNRILELNTYIDTCLNKMEVRWAKRKLKEVKAKTDFYTDFYLGTLLALDSLKSCDFSINLNVYDTQGDSNVVRYLINKHDLQNMDLIIGPPDAQTLNIITDYLGNKDVQIVLPTAKVEHLEKYKNIFQVIPSEEILKQHLAKFAASQINKNLIIIADNDSLSTEEAEETKKLILQYAAYEGTTDSSTHVEIIYFSDTLAEHLETTLSDSIDNFITIVSKNEILISNVTRDLFYLEGEYKVSILGNPGWVNLLQSNNLNIDYLHKLNVIYFTPFYYDYSKENVKQFLDHFRESFRSEPYSVLSGINPILFGYDLTLFFGSRLGKPNTGKCPENRTSLLTDYEFVKMTPDGGFENVSVTFISFDNDFTIRTFKPYELKY